MAKSAEEVELETKINALADSRFGAHDAASLKKLFMSYDANGDGKIDSGELSGLYSDAGVGNFATRGVWVSETFKKVDVSPKDGQLTWEEYLAASSIAKATPATPPPPGTNAPPPSPFAVGEGCDPATGLCYGAETAPVVQQASFPILPLLVGGVALAIFGATLSAKG